MVNDCRILLPVFLTAILISCLTIEADISIEDGGSGTAEFVYSVTGLALDLMKTDEDNRIIPFPVQRADFEEAALENSGISDAEYESSNDGSRYFINSKITFDSLESLSSFSGVQFSSVESGNNQILTVLLRDAGENGETSDETLSIIGENFPDDYFSVKMTIPGDIVQVNGATFSGNEVSFTIGILDLLQSSENTQFTVEYR